MIYTYILPLLIGALGVFQNTLNKKIGDSVGLGLALVVNNIVLLASSLMLFLALRLLPQESLPDLFRQKSSLSNLGFNMLLPGLFGFVIIVTAPLAISKVGATKVFIGIIVAQIFASLAWDYFAESIPMDSLRLLGAGLTLIGAFFATR